MLDIKALEAAFARLGEIGKGEIHVEVDGVRVWMRSLTPEQDVAVQRYARGDGNVDEMDNITLIERFKRATLAFAIVQVDDLDLRGVTSIPTGEFLDSGVPVKVPKFDAVRRITEGWSRHATTILFQQYAELVKRVEDDANARVRFDGVRVDAEIERLESRLTDLRRMQAAAQDVGSSALVEAVLAGELAASRTAIPPAPTPPPAPAPPAPAPPTPAPVAAPPAAPAVRGSANAADAAMPASAQKTEAVRAPASLEWCEVIEKDCDPKVVTDAVLREAIVRTGLPWRVRDKSTGIEMLLVPPGQFTMGKSAGDAEALANEVPAHSVTLTQAFYLGRYEVTKEQLAKVLGSDARTGAERIEPGVQGVRSMRVGAERSS